MFRNSFFYTLQLLFLFGCGETRSTKPSVAAAPNEAWDDANNPSRLGQRFELNFSKLPVKGTLEVIPWSDTYWPSVFGGLARRWNDPDITERAQNFEYLTPDLAQIESMGIELKSKLSPAEKYSLYIGDMDFKLVKSERVRTKDAKETWQGLCAGWAPAALNFKEPRAVVLKSPTGVEVPFGAADVKALLSYYIDSFKGPNFGFMGHRCNIDTLKEPGAKTDFGCRDTNAGSFHAVVSNMIGLMKRGFVIDVTRDLQVWNQPAHTFESKILDMREPTLGASLETSREFLVETKLTYTLETEALWESGHADHSKTYFYSVEVNEKNEIIGGQWLNTKLKVSDDAERPDFIWNQDAPKFENGFEKIGEIYAASIK